MSGRSISSLRNNEHRVPLVKTSSEWYRTREEPIQTAFSGQQREWHEMKLESEWTVGLVTQAFSASVLLMFEAGPFFVVGPSCALQDV